MTNSIIFFVTYSYYVGIVVINRSKFFVIIIIYKIFTLISFTIFSIACRVRLVTLELCLKLLGQLLLNSKSEVGISETQRASLFSARMQSMTVLRNFYKSEDIFLDLFEDE